MNVFNVSKMLHMSDNQHLIERLNEHNIVESGPTWLVRLCQDQPSSAIAAISCEKRSYKFARPSRYLSRLACVYADPVCVCVGRSL